MEAHINSLRNSVEGSNPSARAILTLRSVMRLLDSQDIVEELIKEADELTSSAKGGTEDLRNALQLAAGLRSVMITILRKKLSDAKPQD